MRMSANNRITAAAAMFVALLGILLCASAGQADQSAAPAAAATPQPAAGLEVFPADVNLETARDAQSLVAKFTQPDGVTRDVTGQCTFEFANPALAKIDGRVIRPLADGATELTVTYNGQSRKLPV